VSVVSCRFPKFIKTTCRQLVADLLATSWHVKIVYRVANKPQQVGNFPVYEERRLMDFGHNYSSFTIQLTLWYVLIVLQPCKLPQGNTDGTILLCRIPVLNLPTELLEELENASKLIFSPNGSGVAVYWTSDGHVRTDIYVGLILDGYKVYQNISALNPNITMQFVPKPTVSCSPGDVHFDPDEDELISIKVGRTLIRSS